MTAQAKSIVDQVMSLPAAARAEVLTQLIENLEAEGWPSVSERSEIDAAWQAEVTRRMHEVESGEAELLDGDDALAEIRAKFAL